MDFMSGGDFMRMMMGKNQERGEQLCKLTAEEEAAWAMIQARGQTLDKEIERITLVAREISLDRDKWFMRVKTDHKLPEGITIYEGCVHKLVDK